MRIGAELPLADSGDVVEEIARLKQQSGCLDAPDDGVEALKRNVHPLGGLDLGTPSGSRNSFRSISPGCVGGRWVGSMSMSQW